MAALAGGTPRPSQQKIELGGETYFLANEEQLGELGGSARAWMVTTTPIQDADASKEFAISLGDFSQGAGFTFATQPGVYEYADGWDATAPGRPGTWARRATLQSLPPTDDYQGWIVPVSTYVYVMRGRYCAKYAIDDTQDAEWPIIELHDFGSGVIVTGRPVVFKGLLYVPLRTGAGGALHVWHQLSSTATVVEQQTLAISGTPTGGSYTLTWQGNTTAAIAWNATATNIQDALRLVPGLQHVTVAQTSGSAPNFTYTVTFTGAGAASVSAMTFTDSMTGGSHGLTVTTTVGGTTDTWTAGPAGKEASCFIVNGRKLWRANANNVSSCVITPTTGGNWGADTEVGESGRDITDLGVYQGDLLVGKTDGLFRFTEDLEAVQELPDLQSVPDNFNTVGMEYSNGYAMVPHKTGLIRWRPGAYQFVGPEQDGSLEGDRSLGWGRVASLAPFGKQLFFAANDSYDRVGVVGSFLPQTGEGRGPLIPHVHLVEGSADSPASFEAVRVVSSQTQPVGPHTPTTWSDSAAVGTLAWSNPGNAGESADSKATASGTGTTHYLKGVAPPLNVPAAATIQGVLVDVERSGWSTLTPAQSTNGGYIQSAGTLGQAQNGTGPTLIATAGITSWRTEFACVGTGPPITYSMHEGFAEFDTSSIPDGATILSATLSFQVQQAFDNFELQARLHDFGPTLTAADWVTMTSNLAAKPLLATAAITNAMTGAVTMVNTGTNLVSHISDSGPTRVIFCSDKQVNGTPPVFNVNDFAVSSVSGSTILTVIYRDILDNIVKLVIGGSVTGANMADTMNAWPGIDTVAGYGGATSTWGGLPTVDQANGVGGDFGVAISATSTGAATFHVDHVQMTVYYTVPGVSDAQSFLVALEITNNRTIATGQAYKLPRANLPPVSDPNVNHATSDATLFTSRYAQPSRNDQKTYRSTELWLEALPETNTPGLQVWASVDDGTPFQLLDSSGDAATLLTTGPHALYFPATEAAVGHYVQLQFRVPALSGGEVPVAANVRDSVPRGVVDSLQADAITATIVLGDGQFVDRTNMRRTAKKQRADIRALSRPGSAPVAYRGPNGESGYLKVVGSQLREHRFKSYDEPVWVAQLTLREMVYGG